jgi:hypothetical protein
LRTATDDICAAQSFSRANFTQAGCAAQSRATIRTKPSHEALTDITGKRGLTRTH